MPTIVSPPSSAFATSAPVPQRIGAMVLLGLSGCFFSIEPAPEPLEPGPLISFGESWQHRSGAFEPGWNQLDFDAGGWTTSPAPLGFGECNVATEIENNCPPGDCANPDSFNCSGQFIAYYFRRSFELEAGTRADSLRLELLVDDGAVIYLNGSEVDRLRMPAGAISPATDATSEVSNIAEGQAEAVDADGSRLREGTNLVAVEVHQEGPGTDVFFDLALSVE